MENEDEYEDWGDAWAYATSPPTGRIKVEVLDFKSEFKSWKNLEKKIRKLARTEKRLIAIVVTDKTCKAFKASSRSKLIDEDVANYGFVYSAHFNYIEKIEKGTFLECHHMETI
ncbi:hypothetical protein TrRE_jg4715, partial [Triparma retinervis]